MVFAILIFTRFVMNGEDLSFQWFPGMKSSEKLLKLESMLRTSKQEILPALAVWSTHAGHALAVSKD
ncbi:hypothetical protein D3C87_2060640 [compost metagenome]